MRPSSTLTGVGRATEAIRSSARAAAGHAATAISANRIEQIRRIRWMKHERTGVDADAFSISLAGVHRAVREDSYVHIRELAHESHRQWLAQAFDAAAGARLPHQDVGRAAVAG